MALEGQPPWRDGNPQGYRLIEETCGGFATTVHVIRGGERHRPRIILISWVRRHAGGRDAEPDDYYWDMMEGVKAVDLTLDQLATVNKIVSVAIKEKP